MLIFKYLNISFPKRLLLNIIEPAEICDDSIILFYNHYNIENTNIIIYKYKKYLSLNPVKEEKVLKKISNIKYKKKFIVYIQDGMETSYDIFTIIKYSLDNPKFIGQLGSILDINSVSFLLDYIKCDIAKADLIFRNLNTKYLKFIDTALNIYGETRFIAIIKSIIFENNYSFISKFKKYIDFLLRHKKYINLYIERIKISSISEFQKDIQISLAKICLEN